MKKENLLLININYLKEKNLDKEKQKKMKKIG